MSYKPCCLELDENYVALVLTKEDARALRDILGRLDYDESLCDDSYQDLSYMFSREPHYFIVDRNGKDIPPIHLKRVK
jgi:hypothetical protein